MEAPGTLRGRPGSGMMIFLDFGRHLGAHRGPLVATLAPLGHILAPLGAQMGRKNAPGGHLRIRCQKREENSSLLDPPDP